MAAIELAVCAPVLFFFLIGIIEFSRLGMVTQLLVNASREGARVAVLQNSASTDVQNRITATLANTGVSLSALSAVDSDPGTNGTFIMPSNWSTAAGDTPITVVIRVSFSQVSWTTPFYLSNAKVAGSATLNSERP